MVLLWGLGFRDRPWTPAQGKELVDFFKNDPKYGGVYLIGGVDPFWRTLRGDSRPDAAWTPVYRSFDAISPWDAGRYRDDASMDHIRKEVWEPDLADLKRTGKGYMPTAFPGFSWDNLRRARPGSTAIPRRKGEFYWRQFAIFKELGIRTVFVGMFDEVDEGTAIYKVAGQTPVGKHFVTYEGLPSDWYLKLTGAATRMIRGEIPLSEKIPETLPVSERMTARVSQRAGRCCARIPTVDRGPGAPHGSSRRIRRNPSDTFRRTSRVVRRPPRAASSSPGRDSLPPASRSAREQSIRSLMRAERRPVVSRRSPRDSGRGS